MNNRDFMKMSWGLNQQILDNHGSDLREHLSRKTQVTLPMAHIVVSWGPLIDHQDISN